MLSKRECVKQLGLLHVVKHKIVGVLAPQTLIQFLASNKCCKLVMTVAYSRS